MDANSQNFEGIFFAFLSLCLAIAIALCASVPPVLAADCPPEMAVIPGGTFQMGADDPRFPEEKSATDVTVDSFCIDRTEVTNAQFAEFVKATGYQTVAERPLSKEQFPDLPDSQRSPGSLVFQSVPKGAKAVPEMSWWHWVVGANWQHPFGADSTIAGQENYPVVHIAYEDAAAYAKWAGKAIPTEAQWEYAARGGLQGQTYEWGDRYSAKKANTWQGIFPFFNTEDDGHIGTAPAGSFPPNGYGLYDMTGNVWEWTADRYRVGHERKSHQRDPVVLDENSFDPRKPEDKALHAIKGGSYLCAPNYCSRFRPAARESESPDTGTTHIGFRLVKIPSGAIANANP